jgi:adenylosuccinate synthase
MSGVCALVGGQFGSEGKGLIAGHIAKNYTHHVRVGAANAGHTVYTMRDHDDGAGAVITNIPEKHVMQQIPCAAYANPSAHLYIGPGAQISPDIFRAELYRLDAWREGRGLKRRRVVVDPRAHVITLEHIEREQRSGLAERIGSTSTIAKEGIGAAQAARVMREDGCVMAEDWFDVDRNDLVQIEPVPPLINVYPSVLLEGTQGTGLSLTTGPFPYTTSRNTTAAGLCADAGMAPNRLTRVILVCRSYPIRVAGNSGPFYEGSQEIAWSDIGVDPENERTTVTKLVRRVATFSVEQVAEAAMVNGATEIALTFADYLDPEIAGQSGERVEAPQGKVHSLVREIEEATGLVVRYIGTGPHSVLHIRDPR